MPQYGIYNPTTREWFSPEAAGLAAWPPLGGVHFHADPERAAQWTTRQAAALALGLAAPRFEDHPLEVRPIPRPRGRQKGWRAPNPRDEVVRFKATADEVAEIDAAAATEGTDRSKFVRAAALAAARAKAP